MLHEQQQAKYILRINTRSAVDTNMFVAVRRLCNWREQRPSNKGDLDSSVTEEIGRVHNTRANLLLI
jgi:hypothetical protein